ncbi:MAG: hypothetical protein RQ739_17155 [Desulfotignum sp.]|nr:hypothetical protein [Desulfotignum sp.]
MCVMVIPYGNGLVVHAGKKFFFFAGLHMVAMGIFRKTAGPDINAAGSHGFGNHGCHISLFFDKFRGESLKLPDHTTDNEKLSIIFFPGHDQILIALWLFD